MKTSLKRNFKRNLAALLLGSSSLVAIQVTAAPLVVSPDGQEVTDNATGLIWRRCIEGLTISAGHCTGTAGVFLHEQALIRARDQATATGVAWRLPNVKELSSLADKSRSTPSIDPVAFPDTLVDFYWSSTPLTAPELAWGVIFDVGTVTYIPRGAGTFSVRLVRDAQ